MRTAKQIAQRAVVMGCLAFRASLEVSEHRRTVELSERLLPWLRTLGIDRELDPIERELLATPYGQLQPEQQTDANWAGEGAAVCCWAIRLAEQPPRYQFADHNTLVPTLNILRPEVQPILDDAVMRSTAELETYCKEVASLRCALQQSRVPSEDVAIVLRKVLHDRLAAIGLKISDDDLDQARSIVAAMPAEERKAAAGLCFKRERAAMWLFDSRPTYFAASE